MDQYLKVFVKVVEKQNFSRAAEELHMTQPAVSQYIKVFEESVGTRLLERSNKYVRLNQAGEIVYRHAKEILALYTKMQTSIDDLTRHASGPIVIGASYTFGEYILPRIIARLQKYYPLITPTVKIHNTKKIIELVRGHQIDIGIIEGTFTDDTLNAEPISDDHMNIVASPSHPLVHTKKARSITELSHETWILREDGSGTRQAAEKLFEMYNMSPQNMMVFGSIQLIKESVEAGLGISLLSNWAIEKEQKNGYISTIPVIELPFKRRFSIVTHSLYQTKALQIFIQITKELVGEAF
ncbi:LysR family transcriptional regulator [Bacillus sp. CLL-7-23]|uniref:LysR family transcriptional regulator n=1 Tax=Bacillus changyiensis TaxID=3004103 RepID=A0ABT4X1I4_9BACI|nr:LysR family transcriptional regulator [Bacillus changyiensis]MDA7026150.1 LysR family transcriptional regulator [Bacillus changyiensis]